MRTNWTVDRTHWHLSIDLEDSDPERGPGQSGRDIGLLARNANVHLTKATEPHPDAEALATFAIVRPWVGRRLVVRRGVSREFAELVHRLFRIDVSPVDDDLAPRAPGRTPVLAYSAGFDSTAASALLPDVPHVHHRRSAHPDLTLPQAWQVEAIEHLTHLASHRGRDVHVVRADFEYLVDPYPSLPHWFGFAVGPILMSEELDAGAIVLGGTLETFYMDMGRRWTGAPREGSGIDPLPELIGMPIMRPLVGVTEIGTMKLTLGSDLADLARSCNGGTFTAPCHACAKCIRKDMLAAVVAGDPSRLDKIPAAAAGWASMSAEPPYYMQAQLEYATSRLHVDGAVGDLWNRLERPGTVGTEWMDRAYHPSVERAVPEQWRETVAQPLQAALGWMTDADVAAMKAWDRTTD